MNNQFSPEQFDNMIKNLSSKTNINPEDLKKAKDNNLDSILSKLNPKQSEKLQEVLSNKESTEKLLNSPQAQALLKKFLGK